jgi:AbrB family looped-hinge helix DNA binding protein
LNEVLNNNEWDCIFVIGPKGSMLFKNSGIKKLYQLLIDILFFWYYNPIKVILRKEAKMPRITSKGQVTIPQDIRNKFGFLPGMEVDVIAEGNKALIVKSRRENRFMNWLGRGKRRSKKEVDQIVDEIRGRSDE